MPSMVSDSAETTLSTAFKTPPRVGREGGTGQSCKAAEPLCNSSLVAPQVVERVSASAEEGPGVVNLPTRPTKVAGEAGKKSMGI